MKHAILKEYAGAWAGIIAQGLENAARTNPAVRSREYTFTFADVFAGAGAYAADFHQPTSDAPIWGSPVIATTQILDELRRWNLKTTFQALFCEYEAEHFSALLQNLSHAEMGVSFGSVDHVSEARTGQASVLKADIRTCSADVARWIGNSFGLVLVDPFGAGMKLRTLHDLVSCEKVDSIILYPATDVQRYGPTALKDPKQLGRNDRSNLTRLNDLFGDERWHWIYMDDGKYAPEDREKALLEHYVTVIREADPRLIVKTIRLRQSAVDRTSYHLVLTTRNESGAIRMNSILRGAEVREHIEVWADYEERERQREDANGVLSLDLDVAFMAPAPPPITEFTPEHIADCIAQRCGSGSFTLRQIWRALANDLFTEGEIQKGLRHLRQQNRAEYKPGLRSLAQRIVLHL